MATESRTARSPRPATCAVPQARAATGVFTVEVCRDPERFRELGPEWDALHARCASATPFQTHAWLHSWWLSYGRRGRLRAVLVRRDGELVAAAPLVLVHRPFPVLVALGSPVTDFCDVLVDDGCRGPAADQLTGALGALARFAVIDLREVRPGAAAEHVFRAWRGPRRRRTDSVCLELPGVPFAELVERLPSSRAQRVRSKLRKADSLGITAHPVRGEEIPGAIARLVRLHERQWAGRGVNPEHLSDRFGAHLARSVRAMVESGHAAVTEFRIGSDVVAADLTLLGTGLAGGYLYGADPVLRQHKVDVSTLLLRNTAGRFGEDTPEGAVLSMLRGAESYKGHWRPEQVRNGRLLLARGPLLPALGALTAYAAARGAAASLVKRWRSRQNQSFQSSKRTQT
jgi:Acetyltransferase (GNAT) domain